MDPRRLADMREAYGARPFEPEDLAPTWHEQLQRWLAEAADAELNEPNAMVLATAAPSGAPSARTVLCKGLDERGVVFFTNLRSRKGREIDANGSVALVFPWLGLSRQAIVEGDVEPLPDRDSDAYFQSRPSGSQLSALASPQSERVASRAALEELYEDARSEHPDGAAPARPQWWGGLRVVPRAVEFWQGRADRLHDRLRFVRDSDRWEVERLAP